MIKGCILKRNKCNGRRAYGVISVIVDYLDGNGSYG